MFQEMDYQNDFSCSPLGLGSGNLQEKVRRWVSDSLGLRPHVKLVRAERWLMCRDRGYDGTQLVQELFVALGGGKQ
jgi:hypothetical protein